MEPEAIREALEATRIWGSGYRVHITGGEPFLNFPLLLHAVETAVELEIPVYVETNAGWCVKKELTRRQFQALKDVGLSQILISCSPFHAETIPPSRTYTAIEIAIEIFGYRNVIVYLPEWLEHIGRFGAAEPVPLQRYIEAYGRAEAGKLFWNGYGLIPGGRSGYRLGDLVEGRPYEAFHDQNCQREILYAHHSHFDLYGHFISGFCGGLTVGAWKDLPGVLSDFSAGRYPALIDLLIRSGPYGLAELAIDQFGYTPIDKGYVGKCHLCVDVRRYLVEHGSFDELQPVGFYDMF